MSSIKVIGESADHVYHGAETVGTTAAAMTAKANALTRGVQLYCPDDNAGTVYVGNRSAATADAGNDTTGFPIPAGSGVFYPCDDVSDVYLIADQADQKVFFLAY